MDAHNTLVKLQKNEITVGQLIEAIEHQTDFLVVYRSREVDTERIVHLAKKSDVVTTFLDEAFENTEVGYEIENKYILLTKRQTEASSSNVKQADKKITGTVKDSGGELIVGASVVEKGTRTGTATDVAGRFSLSVGENAVLRISYLGYVTQEITVGNQTNLNIILQEDSQILDEVVIVGYGTQKKADLGGAIATLNARDIETIPVANLVNALAGRLTGVAIT